MIGLQLLLSHNSRRSFLHALRASIYESHDDEIAVDGEGATYVHGNNSDGRVFQHGRRMSHVTGKKSTHARTAEAIRKTSPEQPASRRGSLHVHRDESHSCSQKHTCKIPH